MSEYKKADKEKEVYKAPEIATKDIDNLREELKSYTQKRINGRLTSQFEQYLLDLGTVVMRGDEIHVKDPAGYTRMSKINTKMDLLDYYSDEEYLRNNPEMKKKQTEKLKAMREAMSNRMRV